MLKTTFFILLLVCGAVCGFAQKTYTIKTDGKGKIKQGLPERLFLNDCLKFYVDDPKDSIGVYKKQWKDKLIAAKSNILKLEADDESMKIITYLYGIDTNDVNKIAKQIDIVTGDNPTSISSTVDKMIPEFLASGSYFSIQLTNPQNEKVYYPPIDDYRDGVLTGF